MPLRNFCGCFFSPFLLNLWLCNRSLKSSSILSEVYSRPLVCLETPWFRLHQLKTQAYFAATERGGETIQTHSNEPVCADRSEKGEFGVNAWNLPYFYHAFSVRKKTQNQIVENWLYLFFAYFWEDALVFSPHFGRGLCGHTSSHLPHSLPGLNYLQSRRDVGRERKRGGGICMREKWVRRSDAEERER